jgi:hypothetical protein
MLDEVEFGSTCKKPKTPSQSPKEQLQEILDGYNRITGFGETNVNAVFHHRISLYGPPCETCGKPLRTPQATFCAACGKKRSP